MLERRSALEGLAAIDGDGVRLSEAADFAIHEVWFGKGEEGLDGIFARPPKSALEKTGTHVLAIAPHAYWYITAHDGNGPQYGSLTRDVAVTITPLRSSRCRMELSGPRAREVLAKCVAIDFHPKVFTAGQSAMTGIHHMPVMIHCIGDDAFHVYAMRTFALHVWEVLADAAHS
jgi:heterotetrameric sarcosine oxidase gamma subunit